jgi:hypothetical protein
MFSRFCVDHELVSTDIRQPDQPPVHHFLQQLHCLQEGPQPTPGQIFFLCLVVEFGVSRGKDLVANLASGPFLSQSQRSSESWVIFRRSENLERTFLYLISVWLLVRAMQSGSKFVRCLPQDRQRPLRLVSRVI